MGLNSGPRLNQHLFFVLGAEMALPNQFICTDSTEPFLCHTAISPKIKCAGSFDLFLE